jgi:hypothetical protein
MALKRMAITVRGTHGRWQFHFFGDPRHISEWEADGLDVHEVCNVIPMWVAGIGLASAWCFVQDIFNFKSPWSRR